MDIKQGPSACAVVTVGKDMTFRDYAQGAFRMRQVGEGQTLVLYLIPEVENRMAESLEGLLPMPDGSSGGSSGGGSSGSEGLLVALPAWLLLNSMRMESLQSVMLCTQELRNVWRKEALGALLSESRGHHQRSDPLQRLKRFLHADAAGAAPAADSAPMSDRGEAAAAAETTLRDCVALFREPLGELHDLCPEVPRVTIFKDKMDEMVAAHAAFAPPGSDGAGRIAAVQAKTANEHAAGKKGGGASRAAPTASTEASGGSGERGSSRTAAPLR